MKRLISLAVFAAIMSVGLLANGATVTQVAAWDTPEPHIIVNDK